MMSHVLKRMFLALGLLMLWAMQGHAQEGPTLLWPIEGKQAGEDILYRPQDYIDRELNLDNLFIQAPEGSQVVCPTDAVVRSISLSYASSLTQTMGFPLGGDFEAAVAEVKAKYASRLGPIRYLAAQIGLKMKDGSTIYISGLRPARPFKTGQRVSRGELLGTVLYSYHKINEPSISLSISSAQGKPRDPMTPFGLKTTYKAPVVSKPKATLSRAEAEADYRQLAQAIRELYPSLEDLMSLDEYDRFVEAEIARLPLQLSRREFGRILSRYNRQIHDSHLFIDWQTSSSPRTPMIPEIMPSKVGGKLVALLASKRLERYIGREITHINGRSLSELEALEDVGQRHIYDAGVRSVLERNHFLKYFFTEGIQLSRKRESDPIRMTFADGEVLDVPMLKQDINKPLYGQSLQGYARVQRVNRHKDRFDLRVLSDTTAYIGLSTFELNEVETDSIVAFIREMTRRKQPALVIDLRNNPGGAVEVLEAITNELLPRERVAVKSYSMVNAVAFDTPTLNLVQGEPIFEGYKPIEGRRGLYLLPQSQEASPEGEERTAEVYPGRVYVLTDAGSASASTELAGSIKRNKRGLVIGRETQSAYHCFTAQKFANVGLKHSQFYAVIPLVRCVFDETVDERFPRGRGVMPDLHIPLSLEEVHSEGDYLLERTLQQIRQDLRTGDTSIHP